MIKDVKGYEGLYQITDESEVINVKTGKTMKPQITNKGYKMVDLYKDGVRKHALLHRLMAEAFLNNCEVVDHIDGNKSNNKLSNLQAITHSENIAKAYRENTYVNPHKGRGIWVIAEDKETGEEFHFKSMRECEAATGIDRHRIKTFLTGERPNNTKYNFCYDE